MLGTAAIAFLLISCGPKTTSSANVPDIPVYPGAQLEAQITDDDRDPTDTYYVRGATEAEVLDWYAREMPKAGWHPITDEKDNVILYNDEAGCYGFVMSTQQNGDVFLQLSQQRPGSFCMPDMPLDPGTD